MYVGHKYEKLKNYQGFFAVLHAHLGLLLLRGVNDGGAAHLSQLTALSVKGPAADLIPDHIFDEEDSATVAERQPVEQLNVLQKVVVWVTVETKAAWWGREVLRHLLRSAAGGSLKIIAAKLKICFPYWAPRRRRNLVMTEEQKLSYLV